MDFSIDMLNLGKADATIIWARDQGINYIIFLDGGEVGHAPRIIKHCEDYIAKHVGETPIIIAVNTHIHADHIGGLREIVKHFQKHIAGVYFNNPAGPGGSSELREGVERAVRNSCDTTYVQFINETLQQARDFSDELKTLQIPECPALAGATFPGPLHPHVRILGPDSTFYQHTMAQAGRELLTSNLQEEEMVNEDFLVEDPCMAVEKAQDKSPDNQVSVILELTDRKGRKYLFTADASAPSFASVVARGEPLRGYHFLQLPHHGSQGNINSLWIDRFAPDIIWVAAPGTDKHPRQNLIDCIKQRLPKCKIYSTHRLKGPWINYTTDSKAFPKREKTQPAPTL